MEKGINSLCTYVDISGKSTGEIYIIELWCDAVLSQYLKSYHQLEYKPGQDTIFQTKHNIWREHS